MKSFLEIFMAICLLISLVWFPVWNEKIISNQEVKNVVIMPGLQVSINGTPARLFGTDFCPGNDDLGNACLIVGKNTKRVFAYVALDGESQINKEILTVKRIKKSKGFYFQDENGTVIVPRER